MHISYQKIGLKKIDTYVIGKFLGTFIFTIVLILSIAVIFDITEKIDNFFDHHAPFKAIVFDYYMSFIPFYGSMLAPMITFISVIFFTSQMATKTEITAILASGISFKRFLKPYAISSLLITTVLFLLGAFIIPHSNKVKLDFENKYIEQFKSGNTRNIQIQVAKGEILYIDRFEETNNTGYQFSLDKFQGKKLISRITGESIVWDSAANWEAKNYMKREFIGMREKLTRGEKMKITMNVKPKELFITSQEASQMPLFELRDFINKQKERGVGNVQAFEDEYYRRYSMPLAAIIMTLIGVTLSSKKVRGGMGLNLGIGLGLSFTYVGFTSLSSSFAVSGVMPTVVAVWLPNIIFLGIGIYLFRFAPK